MKVMKMTVGKKTCAVGVGCCCPHLGTGFKCALFDEVLTTAGSPKGWVKRSAKCIAAGTPAKTTASDEEIVATWRKGSGVTVFNVDGLPVRTLSPVSKNAPTDGVLRLIRDFEKEIGGTIRVPGPKAKAVK